MITRLDDASARKISAGQVITTLSSVVKELLENALDAGAQSVNIRLHRFGLDKIVVEDDGEGIPMPGVVDKSNGSQLPSGCTPLLQSRATTKRRRKGDEDGASGSVDDGPSLGFRGEALHSLAQMSNVTVETMHAAQAPYTVRVTYDSAAHEAHLAVNNARQSTGTAVTVENLFKHLPVRHKEFVKNQRKQLLNATALTKQYAVSHPRLRLVFSHQESPQGALVTLVSLTGSNDLRRSVTEAYGGLCLSHMTRVEWHCTFGDVEGFISQVDGGGRMAADRQVFSLDGRLVDLPRIAAALNDAFGQCLPNAHQRQSVAFFLRISTRDSVGYDVNLTPNKRKVLIGHEEKLAEEIHAVALKEFRAASEGIAMECRTHSQQPLARSFGSGGGAWHGVGKEVRMPVSATAFTQYTFRRSGDATDVSSSLRTDEEDAEVPVISLDKLGMVLYNSDAERTPPNEAGAEPEMTFSTSSTTSRSDEDGEHEEGTKEGRPSGRSGPQGMSSDSSTTPATSSRPSSECSADDDADLASPSQRQRLEEEGEEGGGARGTQSEELLPMVVQLSDEGNQRRGEGATVAIPFPLWGQLAALGTSADGRRKESRCGCGDATLTDDSECNHHGHGFSAFLEQTGKELTAYFHKRSFKDMVVLGQFNHGFIIASLGDDLFVIDQHASDEKYNYERLIRAYTARPQPLVQPIAVPMDAEEVDLAVTHAPDLLKHGFTVTRGEDPTKLLVSSVPVLPYDVVSAADVLELVQQLVRYGTITRQLRAVWHSLATKACRTSIMIGTALSESTMRTIVARLGELDQPWTCPHGRPTLRHLGNTRAFCIGEKSPLSYSTHGATH